MSANKNRRFEFAIWSEAAQFTEAGLTSTGMVCDHLELYGTPFREPLVRRETPAPVLVYNKDNLPSLSEKALMVLHTKAPSKRELRRRRKMAHRELSFAQRTAKVISFANKGNLPFEKKLAEKAKPFAVTK